MSRSRSTPAPGTRSTTRTRRSTTLRRRRRRGRAPSSSFPAICGPARSTLPSDLAVASRARAVTAGEHRAVRGRAMTGVVETREGSSSTDDGGGEQAAPRPALSILITVRGALPNLRPAEQRVAELVLSDPAGVSESSITAVAKRCQTSETTVLRFCRAIGLAGYPELRIALARAALWEESGHAPGHPTTGQIDPGDSLADVVAKITHADACAIADTAAALDLDVLEKAVEVVAGA